MLIRLVISNFLSIGKECEFNMLPAPLKNHQNHLHNLPAKRLKVLKGAAIYGANGAGKSNIVKAIGFVQSAVLSGVIMPNVSHLKYKLDSDTNKMPTVFDVEFEWNNKFYAYHLELQDDMISNESLYELGFQKDDKVLFERVFNDKTQKINVTIGGRKISNKKNKMLSQLLANNILDNGKILLSNHAMFNDPKISNAYTWFREGLQIILPETVYPTIAKPLSDSAAFNNFANGIITTLDTGVSKIGVNIMTFDEFFKQEDEFFKRQLIAQLNQKQGDIPVPLKNGNVLIASIDDNHNYVIKKTVTYHKSSDNSDISFDVNEESDGTRRLLDIIPAIDLYLNKGTTVIIDEVDKSLHPALLKAIMLKIMESEPVNGGQFIVTTHESNLLDYEIYRQDEIWFVEKHDGMTEIYPLTDFKPRADLQIQKGYLMGRFGAVPFLANLRDINWQ